MLLPSIYGLGTSLPALVFAVLVAVGARSVAKSFNALSKFEWWARRITGVVFLGIGLSYSLKFIFGVL